MSHTANSFAEAQQSFAEEKVITPSERLSQRRSLRAAAMGNIIEWFDWTLYAVFSTYIAANLFNNSNPVSAILAAFGVFAAGFLARPVGAWFFGKIADNRGRKFVLVTTISTMSVASLAIAVIPTYESIGAWASLLLLVARLLQGFAHGGESGVSYTYVAEIAPKRKRGLWSSSVFVAVTVGVMLATLLGAVFNGLFGAEAVESYAWRFAFVVGALLGLVVLILRRTAVETEQFDEAQSDPSKETVDETIWNKTGKLKAGLLVVLLACGHNCAYYIWAIFASSLAIADRGMEPTAAFIASLLAQGVTLVALGFFGWLSDRIGRKPLMIAFGVSAILFYYPLSNLISDEPWTLFVAQALGTSIWAMAAGMYPALMSELFPTPIRATNVAVATAVSVSLFGGTAAYLVTWTESIDMAWAFWVWMGFLAALAVVGALLVRETKGTDLKTVGWPFLSRGK